VREGSKMRGNNIATCEEIGREMDISDSETIAIKEPFYGSGETTKWCVVRYTSIFY
jgi:hypothetical protein